MPRIWLERANIISDICRKLCLFHPPLGIHSIFDSLPTLPVAVKLTSNLRHDINHIVMQLLCLIIFCSCLKLEVRGGGYFPAAVLPATIVLVISLLLVPFDIGVNLGSNNIILGRRPLWPLLLLRERRVLSGFRMLWKCSGGMYTSFSCLSMQNQYLLNWPANCQIRTWYSYTLSK